MSVPVIYGLRRWICDRDPLGSEATNVPIELWDIFQNTVTGDIFLCINDTPDALQWTMQSDGITHTQTRVIVTVAAQANGFQISTTRKIKKAKYTVDLTCTSTIAGASSVVVVLETCPTNSAIANDWTEQDRIGLGITVTLAVALQAVPSSSQSLVADNIPAGYFTRIRSIISGTATATYRLGRETY